MILIIEIFTPKWGRNSWENQCRQSWESKKKCYDKRNKQLNINFAYFLLYLYTEQSKYSPNLKFSLSQIFEKVQFVIVFIFICLYSILNIVGFNGQFLILIRTTVIFIVINLFTVLVVIGTVMFYQIYLIFTHLRTQITVIVGRSNFFPFQFVFFYFATFRFSKFWSQWTITWIA
jgi:hypothetical protein